MKEFKKNNDGLFICEECGKLCKNIKSLACHLIKSHNINSIDYYNKWININNNKCICGNNLKFINLNIGYGKFCCVKCSRNSNETQTKERKTNLIKYGVEYRWQNKVIRNKIQIKANKTKEKLYGISTYNNSEKRRKTCIKKYGVEHTHQNIDIFEKSQKSRFKLNKYKDTAIWYQGSYEFVFLEKYYQNYNDLTRGPSIKFKFNNKNKVYHPDFYIPSLNLIIECKNSYLYKRYYNDIIIKKNATINNGYNYVIIIDKDYSNLYL